MNEKLEMIFFFFQAIVVCFMKKECKVNIGKMNPFMFLYINSMSKQSLSLPHIKKKEKKNMANERKECNQEQRLNEEERVEKKKTKR